MIFLFHCIVITEYLYQVSFFCIIFFRAFFETSCIVCKIVCIFLCGLELYLELVLSFICKTLDTFMGINIFSTFALKHGKRFFFRLLHFPQKHVFPCYSWFSCTSFISSRLNNTLDSCLLWTVGYLIPSWKCSWVKEVLYSLFNNALNAILF